MVKCRKTWKSTHPCLWQAWKVLHPWRSIVRLQYLYHSLVKERPPPTFGPISCTGSMFTQMSTHPGASFAWSLRSTASSAVCRSEVRNFTKSYYKASLRRQTYSVHCKLHNAHGDMVPFRVLFAIRTWLRSCWWFFCMLLITCLRVLSHC